MQCMGGQPSTSSQCSSDMLQQRALRAYRSKLGAHQDCLKPRMCSGGLMRYRFAPCCGPCSVDLSELALQCIARSEFENTAFPVSPSWTQLAMVSMHGVNDHRHVATLQVVKFAEFLVYPEAIRCSTGRPASLPRTSADLWLQKAAWVWCRLQDCGLGAAVLAAVCGPFSCSY